MEATYSLRDDGQLSKGHIAWYFKTELFASQDGLRAKNRTSTLKLGGGGGLYLRMNAHRIISFKAYRRIMISTIIFHVSRATSSEQIILRGNLMDTTFIKAHQHMYNKQHFKI
jgi:hypothetical protein